MLNCYYVFLLQYVRCNIPGPIINRQQFHEQFDGCKCLDDCFLPCNCLARFNPSYGKNAQLVNFDPYAQVMKPVYECNKVCKCKSQCSNRVVQNGVHVSLQVIHTVRKGLGLQALCDVAQYTFICEYAGEVLTYETARKRTKALRSMDCNYILVVREHVNQGKVLTTIIDPTYIGNVGRFINHSCEPNLFMVPVRINNNIPRIALFALRDIKQGEELCYDYSGDVQKLNSKDKEECSEADGKKPVLEIDIKPDPKEGKVELRRKTCYCESTHCRGYLPFDDTLYAEQPNCTVDK